MRLFIAILFDEPMRRALRETQDELKRRGVDGGYTSETNLHLTLAFIGEYPDPGRVLDLIGKTPLKPFDLRLEGIGAFGSVWWAGIEPCEALMEYAARLRKALADADIPFDGRDFVPHITLVRNAAGALPEDLPLPEAVMPVRHIALMRSEWSAEGVIYTEVTGQTDPF